MRRRRSVEFLIKECSLGMVEGVVLTAVLLGSLWGGASYIYNKNQNKNDNSNITPTDVVQKSGLPSLTQKSKPPSVLRVEKQLQLN